MTGNKRMSVPGGLRLSPYDRLAFMAWVGIFRQERYAEAIDAARRAIQSSPGLRTLHVVFTAALAESGRSDEARAAETRVFALQPNFTVNGMCTAFGNPRITSCAIIRSPGDGWLTQ
jgi:adenylate cyclase